MDGLDDGRMQSNNTGPQKMTMDNLMEGCSLTSTSPQKTNMDDLMGGCGLTNTSPRSQYQPPEGQFRQSWPREDGNGQSNGRMQSCKH
eukprot:1927792-Ditylum_brightwellii.AAC.1